MITLPSVLLIITYMILTVLMALGNHAGVLFDKIINDEMKIDITKLRWYKKEYKFISYIIIALEIALVISLPIAMKESFVKNCMLTFFISLQLTLLRDFIFAMITKCSNERSYKE